MASAPGPGASSSAGSEEAPTVPAELAAHVAAVTKRTYNAFAATTKKTGVAAPDYEPSRRLRVAVKTRIEYPNALDEAPSAKRRVMGLPEPVATDDASLANASAGAGAAGAGAGAGAGAAGGSSDAIVLHSSVKGTAATGTGKASALTLARRQPAKVPTPKWHAPWKLMRVISGHNGWVRAVTVEPGNEWFATGCADRTIKVWDLASGTLRVTLTGHINCIRGLAVSPRHPYMFSCAEDKMVKCWDLEYNKVIRHYHGHLSGVYALSLHPTLDVLITGGRDAVARVWDMRSRAQIHVLGGHTNTVDSILTQSTDPQVITGSMDSTVKLWDLAAGKCMTTLTNHKKGVRAMAMPQREHTFVSGSADNIKKWYGKDGTFLTNFSGHNAIVNAMAVNEDDVLVSGGDDGTLKFWDYTTGYNFHSEMTRVQPGSLDAEAGIYTMTFDQTGSRLITGEADKTIKVWKEDDSATPETHPVDMEVWRKHVKAMNRRR